MPGAVEGIQSALEWAGLEYDHGQSNRRVPSMCSSLMQYQVPGNLAPTDLTSRYVIRCAPYATDVSPKKSERLDLYHSYADKLLDVCTPLYSHRT